MRMFKMSGFVKVVLAGVALAAGLHASAVPRVVVSIAPLHSLVAGLMDGVGEPRLLIPADRSPHTYALRPSDARALESAALVLWIGPALENFLERPLANLVRDAEILAVLDVPGLRRLAPRDDRGLALAGTYAGAADEADGEHDGHGHGPQAASTDPHVWLDPRNAQVILRAAAAALARIDPPRAALYERNLAARLAELDALDERIAQRMAPLAGRRFIVFHDAYQYFERHYRLEPGGVLTLNPEVSPGADRIRRMRRTMMAGDVACLFIEPQFPRAIASTLTAGTDARVALLDPLGAELVPGPGLYVRLLETMAASFVECLAPLPAAALDPAGTAAAFGPGSAERRAPA